MGSYYWKRSLWPSVCGSNDGNRVAIKSFPELDIDNISDSNRRKSESPMIGQTYSNSLQQPIKSWKSGGYECLNMKDNDDEDIKPFHVYENYDEQMMKKIYARKKEIYSEVVLASSLPT